jgi:hypothetical protein
VCFFFVGTKIYFLFHILFLLFLLLLFFLVSLLSLLTFLFVFESIFVLNHITQGGMEAQKAWPRLAEYFARFQLSLGLQCSLQVMAPSLSPRPLFIRPVCEKEVIQIRQQQKIIQSREQRQRPMKEKCSPVYSIDDCIMEGDDNNYDDDKKEKEEDAEAVKVAVAETVAETVENQNVRTDSNATNVYVKDDIEVWIDNIHKHDDIMTSLLFSEDDTQECKELRKQDNTRDLKEAEGQIE